MLGEILLLISAIFIFISPHSLNAQPDYYIQHFNSDNGLPLNGLKSAAFDKNTHFLWIATDGGILRYDGMNMKIFTNNTIPSVESERSSFLTQNKYNDIYFGNEYGTLFKIEKNFFSPLKTKIRPSNIHTNKQQMLLQVSESLYNSVDSDYSAININSEVLSLASVNDSTCFGLDGDGIAFFKILHERKQVINSLFKDSLIGLFKLNDRIFYLTKSGITFSVESKNKTLFIQDINNCFHNQLNKNAMLFWNEGRSTVLLFNNGKIYELQYKNNKIVLNCILNKIPDDIDIKDLLYIPEIEELFIFSNTNGFYELKKKQLLPSDKIPNTGGFNKYTLSQIALSDSTVLTGTDNIFGSRTFKDKPFHFLFDYIAKKCSDGNIWFIRKSNDSIFSYSPLTGKTTLKFVNPSIFKLGLVEQNDTIFIICSEGVRYYYKDKSGFISRFTPEQAETFVSIDIVNFSHGDYLMGTYRGLLKINLYNSDKVDTILHTNGTPVRSICKYKNYYFIGTYGKGIFIYDGKKISPIPIDIENNLLYAHCFVPDQNGHCWISSNKGLYEASFSDMISSFEDTTIRFVYYYHYGKEDGMRISELNGGCNPCAVTLKNNTISFPSVQGVVWVKPNQMFPVLPVGKIYIDEMFVDKLRIGLNDSVPVILPSDTKQITLQLSIINWSRPGNLYVYYTLDNQPAELVNYSDNFKILLNNLSYGNHTVIIYKLNGFGKNNFEKKVVKFTINTPWFLQWWFISVTIILILIWLWMVVWFRTRMMLKKQIQLENLISKKTDELKERNLKLEKNDQIKTRLISIISHDIITPLKFIHMSSKNLVEKREHVSDELLDDSLKVFADTSKELEVLATNILNWIKYQHQDRKLMKESFHLYQITDQIIRLVAPLYNPKKITIQNQISENMEVYQCLEPIKIIIYNLVLNAIYFTPVNGLIQINCIKEKNTYKLTITDNGIGMTKEQSRNILSRDFIVTSQNVDEKRGSGLGYLIIRDLLKIIEAEIAINSDLNKGTEIEIYFS